jgi:hypothetical protein
MGAASGILKTRLERLMDERATVTTLHDDLLTGAEARDGDKTLTEIESKQLAGYKIRAGELDTEITELGETLKRQEDSARASNEIRAHLAGDAPGVENANGEIKYRSFATYARDVILTRSGPIFEQIVSLAGGDDTRNMARERLMRAPVHTLTSDVEGLLPEQHISQIFQVIDDSRPLVASATRVGLTRGRLTFPKIVGRPVVALQATEKTEGGNAKLEVDMQEATASTYIGGGNLSWQTIEWSSPDALDLWFRIAASDYALKTEQDAGEVLQSAGFLNIIGAPLGATPTYAQWIAAIVEGAGDVYANSGRIADTLYMSPGMFYGFAALQTDTPAVFLGGGLSLGGQSGGFAGLRIVVSRGLDTGVAIVGDSDGLLVAETAGAPVQLRAVEPAIGGLEVGIIGAFEAVVVEDEAFALLSTAS